MNKNQVYRTLKYTLIAIVLVLSGSYVTKYRYDKMISERFRHYSNWQKLEFVLSKIDDNYVEAIDFEKVTEDVLPHLLRELDPHSVYLPPQNLQKSEEDLSGSFEGIGISFNVPNDTAVVISLITGGPSQKAGLLPGDRIMKVNGTEIAGVNMPQDSMIRRMRGPSGSIAHLDVLRDGFPLSFDVTRAPIPVKSIDVAYMINDTTGYIKLSKFSRTSHTEFKEAATGLIGQGMTRLLFDLRDNTGGFLDQALMLSNEFLGMDQLIVYMEGLHRKRQEFTADGYGICRNIELDVLVNESSASSSEIFAGAMQDNDRGRIVGRRTFGKGLVQEPTYFTDGSGMRLTVARYYTPVGRCIQKPYGDDEDYDYDIYERYNRGEMTSADSIPHNDSLRFVTKGGKVVYGGGGIIPDLFVPIDTAGVTDLYIDINRRSLQVRYAISVSDHHRKQLQRVEDMEELEYLLDTFGLESGLRDYVVENGVEWDDDQWGISREFMLTQLRALVARYSSLEDLAFYSMVAPIDNVIQAALE